MILVSRSRERLRAWYVDGGFVLRAALALIAVQTLLRSWMLFPGSYWQDDFIYLLGARQDGFSKAYIFQSYNGHLMPGGFVLNWAIAQFPGSFFPAALTIVLMQLVTSLMVLALLRRVVGDVPSLLVGLSVYLFTPLALASALWWAAATQAIPLQASMCLAAYCHVRLVESERRRWVAGVVAAMLLGFLFWEKAVVIPVFLFLITILVVPGNARMVATRLWSLWKVWSVYAFTAIAYAFVYLSSSDVGKAHVQSVQQLSSLVRLTVVDTFLVGILGGPWTGAGLFGTAWPNSSGVVEIFCAQIFAAVVLVGYLTRGGRSLLGWAVLLGFLGVDLALTAWGRGYWTDLVGRDPRYIADALPVAAVAMAYALRPGRSDEPAPRTSLFVNRPWLVAGVAVLILFNSSLVSNLTLGSKLRHVAVRNYVEHARQALREDPGLAVYDGQIPADLMIPAFGSPARVSTVLGAYAVSPRYNVTSEDLSVLDDTGTPRDIALVFAESARPDEVPGCGEALSTSEQRNLALSGRVKKGTWVLRLDYYTAADGSGTVIAGSGTFAFQINRGLHSVFMVVPGGESAVTVKNMTVPGVLCVSAVTVGFPTPTQQ
jgi:hypothetical protein